MNKPIEPIEPQKTFSKTTYKSCGRLTNDGDSVRLFDKDGKAVIVKFNYEIDYSEGYADVEIYYDEPSIETIVNNRYESELAKYQKKLKKYNENVKKYGEYLLRRDIKRKIREEKFKEKQRLLELKELERLKKKYEA